MQNRPIIATPTSVSGRARVRVCVRATTLALVVLLAAVCATVTQPRAATATDVAATATTPLASIPARGARWFGLGANVPYLNRGCDFGCGERGGARGNAARIDSMFQRMSRRGVRVVRWQMFTGGAGYIGRSADGTPTSVSNEALRDLDVAARLARKHDVYLLLAVLPDPAQVPITWFTVPAQSQALATALRPMFARYRTNLNVLGWELATGSETLVDANLATAEQIRGQVAAAQAALDSAAPQLGAVGPADVSRISDWVGVGVDIYTPQYVSDMTGERSALARSVATLAVEENADRPVVIGGFDATGSTSTTTKLDAFASLGYAGALSWSWTGAENPLRPGRPARTFDSATWRYAYAHAGAGPRLRPLNPCIGPDVATFVCPNLVMDRPSNFSLGRVGKRVRLYSRNSINSVGLGPASIHGTRNGRYTMSAVQLLHRRSGARPLRIATGAKLRFKAIPGQYRYWKWDGAARMELWRLDSAGTPVSRARIGPKTVYCLRDLTRTRGGLRGAPRGRVFPGCNQSLSTRSVTLGTSVGWSDIYPASYHENWVDVTGLRGCFAYVHIGDPTDAIYESNEDDNTSRVVVRLPYTGSSRGCPGAKPLPTLGTGGTY